MEYTGKLYGRIGGVYFDTSHTSKDWDNLIKENNDLKKQLEKAKTNNKRRLRKEYNKGFKDGQSNASAFESSRKQLNGK